MSKKTVYIAFMSIFCLYLFFSTRIIVRLDDNGNDIIREIDFDSIQHNSQAYVCLDSFQNIGGLLESVFIQGWGYCETEKDNSNKRIVLILKHVDSKLCYAVETKAQFRPDVYGAFIKKKKIYNDMNGVESQFSTAKMKSGKYHFYVQVIENEFNSGLMDMNMEYIKDGNGLR